MGRKRPMIGQEYIGSDGEIYTIVDLRGRGRNRSIGRIPVAHSEQSATDVSDCT